jgi:hypothetical protein
MELEDIMVNKVSQAQKDKHLMLLVTCKNKPAKKQVT